MSFILDLLTLPLLGAPRMVHWLATKMAEEAQREFLDEGRVRGELLTLQQRYDAGEIEAAEYDQRENALLERLNAIRELKAQQN